mgnify:CR=1 FL=1
MVKSKKTNLLLDKSKEILMTYANKGIKLTLRQLYYQLVSENIISNNEKEYKNLSRILTNARYSGEIDWKLIEDRIRIPNIPNTFRSIKHLLEVAKKSYQLNRWEGQEYYIEVWAEKDALASVIEPITNKYQVPFCVNRGYASVTAIFEGIRRLNLEKINIILYIGDHDPSGLDMIRDIQKRLDMLGANAQVIPIALTIKQIKKYNLPPNPTKITDARAKNYVEEYGGTCWEADALSPEVLQEIVEYNILKYLDTDKFNLIIKQEQDDLISIGGKLK